MPSVAPIPPGYHTLTVYLLVPDVSGFLDFLRKAFDAQVVRTMVLPDGRVEHAEVRMGDSHLMIGDPSGRHAPNPAVLYFYVPRVDAVYQQALAAGATAVQEPMDMFYGDRSGGVKDNWGNTWWIATHIEDVNDGELDRRFAQRTEQRAKDAARS